MEKAEKLTVREMLAAKPMWSEIFYEDSRKFTDYYFAEKMPDNTGYGIKCGGELRAMLFLTPYTGRILAPDISGKLFQDVPLSYIVGVGTKAEYRHRGYMDALLRSALMELHEKGQPFTFLMPAAAAIYEPYQFRYIYEKPVYQIRRQDGFVERGGAAVQDGFAERGGVMEGDGFMVQPLQDGEEGELAELAEELLESRFQLFLKRDAAYYKRQKKESLAQNGDIYVLKENGRIRGFYLYACEDGRAEIQETMAAEDFSGKGMLRRSGPARPLIMARITDVGAMLSLIRLSQRAETDSVSVRLTITDPLIAGNNGTFLWTVGKKESTIALLDTEAGTRAQLALGVEDLLEFLFGRRRGGAALGELPDIEPLSRLCLNEIV